jgi:hypothetical protein
MKTLYEQDSELLNVIAGDIKYIVTSMLYKVNLDDCVWTVHLIVSWLLVLDKTVNISIV